MQLGDNPSKRVIINIQVFRHKLLGPVDICKRLFKLQQLILQVESLKNKFVFLSIVRRRAIRIRQSDVNGKVIR